MTTLYNTLSNALLKLFANCLKMSIFHCLELVGTIDFCTKYISNVT